MVERLWPNGFPTKMDKINAGQSAPTGILMPSVYSLTEGEIQNQASSAFFPAAACNSGCNSPF